jgi:hypothetical protein
MTTELVCRCGNRLKVSIQKNGWLLSLLAVSLANRWRLDHLEDIKWEEEIPGHCPKCHAAPGCQCRDC